MCENKTLIILGNGFDLELGYNTTWKNYWKYRTDIVLRKLRYETIDQHFSLSLKKYYVRCNNREFNHFSKLDIDEISSTDDFLTKISFIIIMCFIENTDHLKNMHFCYMDFIFAAIFIYENYYRFDSFEIVNWYDIEDIMKNLFIFDEDPKSRKVVVGLTHSNVGTSLVYKCIWDVAKCCISNEIGNRSATCWNKDLRMFENIFKNFILSEFDNTNVSEDVKIKFIDTLLSFRNSFEFANPYDILDFNYETLDFLFKHPKHPDKVFQPHGNVLTHVFIGHNKDGSQISSSFIKDNGLSKIRRSKMVVIDEKNMGGKRCKYHIDLADYNTVIIYGWSLNEIDNVVFDSHTAFDQYGDHGLNPHTKFVNFVVITNDKFYSVKSENLTLRYQLQRLCYMSGVELGDIKYISYEIT